MPEVETVVLYRQRTITEMDVAQIKNSLMDEFAKTARCFLEAAKTLYAIENRRLNFWFPCYYLLSHSLELAIKDSIEKAAGTFGRTHNIVGLAQSHRKILNLSEEDIEAIGSLAQLNTGPGGLRYPNLREGRFLPTVFNKNKDIVERLLAPSFQGGK